MSTITILCPNCGFGREVQRRRIPPRPVHATCPQCGSRFPFSGHLEVPPLPPPAEAFDAQQFFAPFPDAAAAKPGNAPPQPALTPDDFVPHRLHFSGQAREYFGIWIVNLLLKIVTLGLYSAWAKVRKRRYFYGNTQLGAHPFAYTGEPLAIFKGWLLGAALFIVYSLGSQVNPLLGGGFGLLFFLGMPWLIVRSRLFNHRNSLYRNLRFSFTPNYREAYLVFALLPLLTLPTLGLIIPYLLYRQKKFLTENSGYGNLRFALLATPGDYYRFFTKVTLGGLLIILLFGGAAVVLGVTSGALVIPFVILGLLAFYFFIVIYVQTGLANLAWNATFLGEAWFSSTLRTRDMAWLYLSNAVGIALSFGLLIPWASIRLSAYRCHHLEFLAPADLRALAVAQEEVGAGGEEIGDIFGIEVGL